MALKKNDKGLTLIELLITIAVIAIVAAISVPVITNVIADSRTNSASAMQEQVNAFIDKYTESGEVSYNGTDEFTAWLDLDGDGVFSSPAEVIETFTVDTEQFAITLAGTNQAPTSVAINAAGATGGNASSVSFPQITLTSETAFFGNGSDGYYSSFARSIGVMVSDTGVNCATNGNYTLEVQTKPSYSSDWTTDPYSLGAPLCMGNWASFTINNGRDMFINASTSDGTVSYVDNKINRIASIGYDYRYPLIQGLLLPDTEYDIRFQLTAPNGEKSSWSSISPIRTLPEPSGGGGK